MDTRPTSQPLALRVGRWSANHWKLAVFGWLGFVLVAVVLGRVVGTRSLEPEETGTGESGRMGRILSDAFEDAPASERVIVQSTALKVDTPAFQAVLADVVRRLGAQRDVMNVRTPREDPGFISSDRHSALVEFDVRGKGEDAADKIDPILATTATAQAAHPTFVIAEFGDASADKQLNEVFTQDLEKAGLLSIPVTLGILLLTFGALVAAGIPLLLALTAVFAALGLLAIPSQVIPVDSSIGAVVLLIGLAVGVDYSMFYLKREREERTRGRTERGALEAAAATSGRAVLISGITVLISMAGMFFTGDKSFSGFAVATMLVVAFAVIGSVTVLPGLLGKLGDRVNKGRVPFISRLQRRPGESRFWSWILDRVLAHPVAFLVVAGGLLAALALPALQMKLVEPSPDAYPRSLPVMKAYAKIQDAFPGGELPALVVVKADDVTKPEIRDAMGRVGWQALQAGGMREPITFDVSEDHTVGTIAIPVEGSGTDDRSNSAISSLRDVILPWTFGGVEEIQDYGVTGYTAGSDDFNALMRRTAPFVFGFVLIFAFILLLLAFRSIVIPIKAILLNLLSVTAAYGVLVLVFQWGWGKDLIGLEYTEGVIAWLPMFLFVILFGLSMDYHVFILSRVRELHDGGATTEQAVARAIKATAGVVTSAAIVMVLVFSVFGTLEIIFLKEFGVGLAAAILIDATIVRAVLLPASMKLLGDWNSYLPSWLEWLPRIGQEKEFVPEVPVPVP